MKIRVIPAILLAALSLAGCGPAPHAPESRLTLPEQVRVRVGGRVVSVPLEEYALGSALAEVNPLNESAATVDRIYEVQAVLARSYAAAHLGRHRADGFDLCDGVHCQLYEPARIRTSRFAAAARNAVQRTEGVILAYAGRPAEALYHADCGGYTAAADAIWGGPSVPYLEPVRDDAPSVTHRSWTRVVSADDLRSALNADVRSRVGTTLAGVDVRVRDVSGRAIELVLRGPQAPVVRGEDFRAILNQRLGDKAIQSTRFTIRRSGQSYVFQGTGYGHGVGLCQLGAAARARRGDSLTEIFGGYFHGAALVKISN